jgi:multiple sugar transport system substrate-binding protein
MAGQPAGGNNATGFTSDINLKTGEINFSSDLYLAAMNLLLALKSDGSFLPGTVSLNVQQTDSMFAQGVAAMYINGSYTFPQWKIDVPNFKYGAASQPVPNSGQPAPLSYAPGGGTYWVYAKTQQLGIVGDIMSYSGTEAGQTALINIIGGSQPSVFAKANTAAALEPPAKKALTLFDQQIKLAPSPELRNPDVAVVNLEMKALTPDFGTTVQGIFTGQLGDPKKALQDLQDRADKEFDRAIKAAQAKGAKVSRDDWKFPNWDPTRDFTDADYTAK